MICRRDNIKLQCKHQPFHAEVAAAVCDIFNGQPMRTTTYRLDLGNMPDVQTDLDMTDTGFRNHPLVPELTNSRYDWSNFIIVKVLIYLIMYIIIAYFVKNVNKSRFLLYILPIRTLATACFALHLLWRGAGY